MKKVILAFVFSSLTGSLVKAQECPIVGTWVVDSAHTAAVKSSRSGEKIFGLDTITLAQVKVIDNDVLILDSIVFSDSRHFTAHFSNDQERKAQKGIYSISKKKFKWQSRTAIFKTKLVVYAGKKKNSRCSLQEDGIAFYNNIPQVDSEKNKQERGSVMLTYKVFPKDSRSQPIGR